MTIPYLSYFIYGLYLNSYAYSYKNELFLLSANILLSI